MSPMVSIIVPVYNAEGSIRRCVDSILRQTYAEFELILVDDGSSDQSGAICDQYAQQDPRVQVIHKENGGVSAARNQALERACGTYIQFLDSDDWITPDATGLLVRAAQEHNCDLVISDFYRVVGERVSVKGDIEEDTVLSREEFAACMMQNPADFYYGVLWNKLYRRDLLETHGLRMDEEISWCEDFLFNMEYIRYARRFYALNVPLYYYVKTKGSLVSQINLARIVRMKLTVFEYYNQLYKDILEEEDYQKQRRKVYRFLVDAAGDSFVPPTMLPSAQKLGKERVQVKPEALAEHGVMADAYREWKLLERCLEPAAMEHDLTLREALVLLALGQDGFAGDRKTLAELAHVSRSGLVIALQQLVFKDYIQVEKDQIVMQEEAEATLRDLERTIEDWNTLRFSGFTEAELAQYKELDHRVRENVRRSMH